jgi:hypothetical protein
MGKIGNIPLLILFFVLLLVNFYSLVKIFRNEKGFKLIIYIVFVLAFPFLGAISYAIYDRFYCKRGN